MSNRDRESLNMFAVIIALVVVAGVIALIGLAKNAHVDTCASANCNRECAKGSEYCAWHKPYSSGSTNSTSNHTGFGSGNSSSNYNNGSYSSTHSSGGYSSNNSSTKPNSPSSNSGYNSSYSNPYGSYDDGYEDVYENDDFDWDRYYSDDDYAAGVDEAMDELDW